MSEFCAVCGSEIADGRKVCTQCDLRAERYGCPQGYMTAFEASSKSGLRGFQIKKLFDDFAIRVGGHRYIEIRTFDKLYREGKLSYYLMYTMYDRTPKGKTERRRGYHR